MKTIVMCGYGLAGKIFHGPVIKAVPGFQVIGILTGNDERISQAKTDFPGALITNDLETLLDLEPDLVVVAGANVTHVPHAQAALSRGINVVIDKPIAVDAQAVIELGALAAANGVAVLPFQNRRWDSDYLTLKAAVESGVIGTPHRFESRLERFRLLPKGGWRELNDPEVLGGVLYDFAPHVVDQALDLMGPVVSVTAHTRTVRETPVSDDDLIILLNHESGGVSYLVGSLAVAVPGPRFTLAGTRGALRITALDTQEDHLKLGEVPGANWGVEPNESIVEIWSSDAQGELTYSTLPFSAGDWPEYYREVLAFLTDSTTPTVTIDQAVGTMRVMDAARESASTGEVVRLDPPASH
jgi:scyllo-inositol 2-dehydrogenase (NADP+)